MCCIQNPESQPQGGWTQLRTPSPRQLLVPDSVLPSLPFAVANPVAYHLCLEALFFFFFFFPTTVNCINVRKVHFLELHSCSFIQWNLKQLHETEQEEEECNYWTQKQIQKENFRVNVQLVFHFPLSAWNWSKFVNHFCSPLHVIMKATMAAAIHGLALQLSEEFRKQFHGQRGADSWVLCTREGGKHTFCDDEQSAQGRNTTLYWWNCTN